MAPNNETETMNPAPTPAKEPRPKPKMVVAEIIYGSLWGNESNAWNIVACSDPDTASVSMWPHGLVKSSDLPKANVEDRLDFFAALEASPTTEAKSGYKRRIPKRREWTEAAKEDEGKVPSQTSVPDSAKAPAPEQSRGADDLKALREKVITLCGSVRFRKEFEEVGADLCFAGYAVLSLSVWGTEIKTGYIDDANPMKKVLEAVHFKKIDLSEAIVVINKDGYLGKSTINEIEYARHKGKRIYWLEGDEPTMHNWQDLLDAPAAKRSSESE